MPWHLSKSDPRKVYDERHSDVCVCQTREQAVLIVEAVNEKRERGGFPASISLREPQSLKPIQSYRGTFAPVHVHQAEGCCSRALSKASLSGVLDSLRPFECPKCGTTYWPKTEGPVTNWEARADVLVFKP